MKIDRVAFFAGVREPVFHGMSQSQVDGCNAILDAWEKAQPVGDLHFLAYILATPWWETGQKMQPVEEIGKGRGRAYGHPTGPWHKVYDGRGLAQDTWIYNYQKATTNLRKLGAIGADIDLVKNPELMLRPDIAAATLIYGMIGGWFTGKKLADYIHGNVVDFVNARRIINGTDKAQIIAATARLFDKALKRIPDVPAPAAA